MNLKTYKVDYNWGDASLTVEVDHDLLTDEILHEINNFWSGHASRLDEANDNVLHAVLTMLGPLVWAMQMECAQSENGIINDFDWDAEYGRRGIEGWPKMDGSTGIRIVDVEDFEFSRSDIEVSEV